MKGLGLGELRVLVANHLPDVPDGDKSVDHTTISIAHILQGQQALFFGAFEGCFFRLDDEDIFIAFGSGDCVRDHDLLIAAGIAVYGYDFFLPSEAELSLCFCTEGVENREDDRKGHVMNVGLTMIVVVAWVSYSFDELCEVVEDFFFGKLNTIFIKTLGSVFRFHQHLTNGHRYFFEGSNFESQSFFCVPNINPGVRYRPFWLDDRNGILAIGFWVASLFLPDIIV